MNEIVITNLIGVVVGVFSSLFAWWILFHRIVPKIEFSEFISKYPTDDEPTGWKYRFKFSNFGSRALLDVNIVAKLSIKSLQFPNSWSAFYIALGRSGEHKDEIPIVNRKANRVVRIFINRTKALRESSILPEEIRHKARKDELVLEDLLVLGEKASLIIYVFGYDQFSGARKLFASKPYILADIKEGRFIGNIVVQGTQGIEPEQHDAG